MPGRAKNLCPCAINGSGFFRVLYSVVELLRLQPGASLSAVADTAKEAVAPVPIIGWLKKREKAGMIARKLILRNNPL